MEHCKTCKHWSRIPEKSSQDYALDSETGWDAPYSDEVSGCSVRWLENSGICRKAELPPADAPDPFDDSLMFVQDGSDYRACLVTREYFGCVLHEPRD
jgi:hypothetical protein